jgi:hypothetical protein
MASRFPAELIKCRACEARDVEVTEQVRAEAVVSCCRCGTALWTWSEFLHRLGTIVDTRKRAVVTTERLRIHDLRAF